MPGIVHTCQRCGACCRWPGDVCLEEREIAPIAAMLGMEDRVFIEQYCRLRRNRRGLALVDRPDGSCIMLEGSSCRIQEAKPEQCLGFPHAWNFPGWEELCPGAGATAREEESR